MPISTDVTTRPSHRNRSLDVLRAIAVLLVIGRHFPAQATLQSSLDAGRSLPWYIRAWFTVGWTGVELFFVLSGYLISGLLFYDYQRYGRIRLGQFMFRRFMKIWPPLYAFLVVMAVLVAYASEKFPWKTFVASGLFYRNYLPLHAYPNVLSHTWSLGVEEHFYFLLPLLLVLLVQHKRQTTDPFTSLPLIFCGLAIVCSVLRGFHPEPTASHMKMDSLFAGVLLRYLHLQKPHWFSQLARSRSLIAVPFLCSIVLLTEGFLKRSIGMACLYVGFSMLLAWSVVRTPRWVVATPIALIGEYSYSIYLWHLPVSMLVSSWRISASAFWLYVGISLVVGIGMSKLVEIPSLRLRDAITRNFEIRVQEVTVTETVAV